MPLLPRHGELLLGPFAPARFLRVENREMPPDDLRGLVALDPHSAGVPAHHAALRIEHEDGVVLDAVDQQPEALLALAQQIFLAPAVRKIARDLGEAAQLAAVVLERGDDHVRPEERAVLAHAPAFVLEAALRRRDLELLPGPSARAGFIRVEGREVAPDDLVGSVALQVLGAEIPGKDVARSVRQKDSVVPYALDEAPQRIGQARNVIGSSA